MGDAERNPEIQRRVDELVRFWAYHPNRSFGEGAADRTYCRASVSRSGTWLDGQCWRKAVETVEGMGACKQHAAKLRARLAHVLPAQSGAPGTPAGRDTDA